MKAALGRFQPVATGINRPVVDTQKLNREPGRPLRELDIEASCICRVQADAPEDDQETKFGICPEVAYGRGEY